MILRLAEEQKAQTMPFIAGIICLVFAVVMFSLAISSLSVERTDQQAAADAAAMAGANALAKTYQTIQLISFFIWLRNMVVDILYVAATIAAIASLGALTEAYDIPSNIHDSTQPAVDLGNKAIAAAKDIAPIYAVANSVIYTNLNNTNNYYGIAVPFPPPDLIHHSSSAEKELNAKIVNKENEIKPLEQEHKQTGKAYIDRKNEVIAQIKADPNNKITDEKELEKKADENADVRGVKSDYVASGEQLKGPTQEKSELEKQQAEHIIQEASSKDIGGDGMVAVVVHLTSDVNFMSFFGGKRQTGFDVAVAAAKAQTGDSGKTIGYEAIRNLVSQLPVIGPKAADAIVWLLGTFNKAGESVRELPGNYSPIGSFIGKALDFFGLTPPSLTEIRPTLISANAATGNTINSQLGGLVGTVRGWIGQIESLQGSDSLKVLPEKFRDFLPKDLSNKLSGNEP